ncbi:hypothetical protein BC829DRAFT_440681 [Chytridium lagenaria]|nr:hypothetical protein BC829DRAFT_440681 [Chytridium lagenaria]
MENRMYAKVLVVGLHATNAGRTCEIHYDGCGKYLRMMQAVLFESSFYQDNEGGFLPCVKCRILDDDGHVGCTVGMLSKDHVDTDGLWDNRIGVVSFLNRNSTSSSKRRASYVQYTSAEVRLLLCPKFRKVIESSTVETEVKNLRALISLLPS